MIYLKMALAYIVIGLFGFGGGYAMLALIEKMVVSPGWITEQMFTDIVAVSQMTPGPIGINSATYIGYMVPGQASPAFQGWGWGIAGSLLCTLCVVAPPFVLIRLTSHWLARHHGSPKVRGVFSGLRPVVVGLIASAAMLLMNGANFGTVPAEVWISVAICAASFALVYFAKLHPIFVICLAALAGYFIYI